MREYNSRISLIENSRGVWCLDPSIGCKSGTTENKHGCYGDCYAARNARIYGYDFNKTVFRYFESHGHVKQIINEINTINMPFIRMGCSGDPSENWYHTLDIIDKISSCNKWIVIITKHWKTLTDAQLCELLRYKVCINTSISVLDSEKQLNKGLYQHERLKPFCKAILRLVTADFNTYNETGKRLHEIQEQIFANYKPIDTVLRVGKNNPLVANSVIKIKQSKFLGRKCYISKRNKKTYFGKCDTCVEMCGVTM